MAEWVRREEGKGRERNDTILSQRYPSGIYISILLGRVFPFIIIHSISMSDTRTLKISKQAFRQTKSKKKQKGGYDDAPGPAMSTASIPALPPLISVSAAPPAPPAPVATLTTSPASASLTTFASPATSFAKGGGLQLAPKKEKLTLTKGKSKTRSNRKVVRIQLGNFRKSVKRAKDIVTESKEKTIEDIEEILSSAGIIKKRTGAMSEGKKETLRGIYRDYLQLRSNAL